MISKAEKTRQFIIEKSAPIFNAKGYSATSMNDILKATGLAKGGVYGNFESKDEIAAAAFEHSYNKLKQAMIETIKQYTAAGDQLLAIILFYKNYTILPITEGGCPILNTAVEADDNIPFLKKKASQAMNEMLGSLQYIIQKGINNGEFKTSLNAEKEAKLFFALIEGGIVMSKVTDDPKILNELLDNLKDQVANKYRQ